MDTRLSEKDAWCASDQVMLSLSSLLSSLQVCHNVLLIQPYLKQFLQQGSVCVQNVLHCRSVNGGSFDVQICVLSGETEHYLIESFNLLSELACDDNDDNLMMLMTNLRPCR